MPHVNTAKRMTVLESIRLAEGYLAKHGVEGARLSAEHLLARRLGCTRLDLYLRFDRAVGPDALAAYREDLRRRGEHYPLQYLLGEIEFMSLPFRVREGVFIPRPETELLVERIEALAGERPGAAGVELGVGSGVVSLSLAVRHPSWTFVAFDISGEAVACARENAAAHGVEERICLYEADGFESVAGERTFDLVAANPPYVPAGEIDGLAPEVSRYESRAALDGGPDGLAFYAPIAAGARRLLRPGGLAAVEIGHGQARAVEAIFAAAGLARASSCRDYNGLERVVTAFAPEEKGIDG